MSIENHFICECGAKYHSIGNLNRHRHQKKHYGNDGNGNFGTLRCPMDGCGVRLSTMAWLCNHVKIQHNVPESDIKSLKFSTFDEFQEWKASLENDTCCSFVRHAHPKAIHNHKYHYFYCSRSGSRKLSTSQERVRTVKKQGSSKIALSCTAHISAKTDMTSGTVSIKYCSHHAGHEADLRHLRLSSAARLEVAALLYQGVTVSEVLEHMHNKLDDSGTLPRDSLLCRRDVINIKRAFNTGCIMKHVDDHTSVHIWIEELGASPDSPVTLYKPRGSSPDECVLRTSDFVLGLQTCTQKAFMLQYGNGRMVCLDCNRATNEYSFNLMTIMVADDLGVGIPVAFLISNREDQLVLQYFFASLAAKLGSGVTFSASLLVTDDNPQYYTAWHSVFGDCEKKLSTWHLDRSWHRAIKQHIPDTESQVEIYHMLRSVMQEPNAKEFERCLASFVELITSTAPQFASYFSPYIARSTEWAYCHRVGTQVHADLESCHNLLESSCMERKANRRLDSLVSLLFRIARDKLFERLIGDEPNRLAEKVRDITSRHVLVTRQVRKSTLNGWLVPSSLGSEQTCFVVALSDSCSCSLRCRSCNCCPHMYECACVDFTVRATVCKHIHTVHSLRDAVPSTQAQLRVVHVDKDITSRERNHVKRLEQATEAVVSETHDAPRVKESCDTDDLPTLQQRVISQCQEIIAKASVCQSREGLARAVTYVRLASSGLTALDSAGQADLVVAKQTTGNEMVIDPLRIISSPGQQPLHRIYLTKPSSSDLREVKRRLLENGGEVNSSTKEPHTTDLISLLLSLSGGTQGQTIDFDAVPFVMDTGDIPEIQAAESV